MSRNDRPLSRNITRPTLEALEARDLLAAYWWSPTVSEYSTDG